LQWLNILTIEKHLVGVEDYFLP